MSNSKKEELTSANSSHAKDTIRFSKKPCLAGATNRADKNYRTTKKNHGPECAIADRLSGCAIAKASTHCRESIKNTQQTKYRKNNKFDKITAR